MLEQRRWQPMGADGDAVMTVDRVGGVIASHGLFARPHDFARFGELLRNGGRTPEGRQVVPETWVDAMTTMTDVSEGKYGLQTWAHPIAAPDAFTASGFQGQKTTVLPSDCLTDVRDGELTDPNAYGFATNFYAAEWQTMLRAIADELGGCSRAATPAAGAGASGSGSAALPQPPSARALPATGGSTGLLGVVLLAAATGVWARAGRLAAVRG